MRVPTVRQAAGDLGINIGDASLTRIDVHGARRVGDRVFTLEQL